MNISVLFVCMGNICRSPTAEGVFRKMVADSPLAGKIDIDSAGTHGYHVGSPPDARAVEHAAKRGYDLSPLRCRQVNATDFERFDYILAADAMNVKHLKAMCPTRLVHKIEYLLDYGGDEDAFEVPDPSDRGGLPGSARISRRPAAHARHFAALAGARMDGLLSAVAYIKIFVAMIVIVNPLGIMPVFVAMTTYTSDDERKKIARIAAVSVMVVLLVSATLGERVLDMFGISIPSFKVGGAILVMMAALSMMQATPGRDKQTPEEAKEAEDKASIAVVPLAIPLLAGPGAMSTIIIYASEKKSFAHLAIVCLLSIGVAVVTWLALRVAAKVGARLSKTTINVATRIMGLLLAALAVEIFAGGIVELIPALGKPDVFRY